MTLTELRPELLPAVESPGIIDRFTFKIEGQEFLVDIANGQDPRVGEARKIEEDTFTVLGDIPEEVKEEFDPHDSYSRFIFMHATDGLGEATQMVGMGRLIPYNPEQGGLKTFVDLGKIAAQKPEHGPDDNRETRIKILDALGMEDLDVEDVEERAQLITREVENKFSQVYKTREFGKLLDIATLAPDMDLEFSDKIVAIDGLLAAMAVYTTDLYHRNELSHLIQFTSGPLHHYLRDLYGYPVQELFGLEDLSYDSFGNGTNENMVSTPSVLISDDLVENHFCVTEPKTEHLGKIATAMGQVYLSRL